MAEGVLKVIAETTTTVATNAWHVIADPERLGRGLVNISRFGHRVRMSMHNELQYERLVRRIYDVKGDVTHQLAIPRIDMLSDLDRDLLLHGGVSEEYVASFFEATFVLSDLPDRLLDISRVLLPKESNLLLLLADLESLSSGKKGIYQLAAVSLTWTHQLPHENETPESCVSNFNLDLKHRSPFRGKVGFARREVSKFLNIGASREMNRVELNDTLGLRDLDQYKLVQAQ